MISEKTADMGYFSCLPPEILNELINFCPIVDVRALYQTGKNLSPIVGNILFAKTQKHLEHLDSKLFEIHDLRIHSNSMNTRYYSLYKEKSVEKAKSGSEERCVALRELICRLFWDMSLSEIFTILDQYSMEDPLLLSQIIKRHASSFVVNLKINKKNDKNLKLFLKMLEGNQLPVKCLKLFIDPLEDTIVTLFAKAIQKNKYLTKLDFEYPLSYPKYFREIMDSIKGNNRLTFVRIKPINEPNWFVIKDSAFTKG